MIGKGRGLHIVDGITQSDGTGAMSISAQRVGYIKINPCSIQVVHPSCVLNLPPTDVDVFTSLALAINMQEHV